MATGVGHEGRAAGAAIIGVDIGTTATKAVAYDGAGRPQASASVGYPLLEPQAGYAEQDPHEILAAVQQSLRTVAAELDRAGIDVAGIAFSSAMHSLLGLDPSAEPVTALLTWADTRATAQAERLRSAPVGPRLHRRTGTPVHPMSPLCKLMWFREQEPGLCEAIRHWASIKDFVLARLCDVLVIDHSLASGTGLLDIHTLRWDNEAMQLAGVLPEQLPELVASTTVLSGGLTPHSAAQTGLSPDTPVVVGGGDGPLANLGVGAVRPGVAACSIGTSGAVRVMVARPCVDPLGGVFCYALTPDLWAVGGAINNGAVVLEWAADALAPELGDGSLDELTDLASSVPAGSAGLLMLPFLLGERAPHWSSLPRGAYVGLTREHRRAHLVRAALEGVCQQLAVVLGAIRAAGNDVVEVRATGGFARSPLWRQMLADVLGMPVHFTAAEEGSSFGAALLGMHALGLVPSLDVAADLVHVERTLTPDPAASAVYARLLPVFCEVSSALQPAFSSLRRLAPVQGQGGSPPPRA